MYCIICGIYFNTVNRHISIFDIIVHIKSTCSISGNIDIISLSTINIIVKIYSTVITSLQIKSCRCWINIDSIIIFLAIANLCIVSCELRCTVISNNSNIRICIDSTALSCTWCSFSIVIFEYGVLYFADSRICVMDSTTLCNFFCICMVTYKCTENRINGWISIVIDSTTFCDLSLNGIFFKISIDLLDCAVPIIVNSATANSWVVLVSVYSIWFKTTTNVSNRAIIRIPNSTTFNPTTISIHSITNKISVYITNFSVIRRRNNCTKRITICFYAVVFKVNVVDG